MRIILANVKYSPNLGDGLLCECLERELRASSPDLEVESVDLAGRTKYALGGGSRRLKLIVLETLPKSLRAIAAETALRWIAHRRLRPHWRSRLAGAHAVIVGGGNLFADADLNFPIKINVALDEARRAGLPVAVFAVGVGKDWSRRGRSLFATGLVGSRLVEAMVRDEESRRAWDGQLPEPGVRRAGITADPGVLTACHFAAPPRRDGPPRIAVGLTDPLAVRYHGGAGLSEDYTRDWLGALVAALATQPCEIVLFTNGSPEDRSFLQRSQATLEARAPGRVSVAPTFRTPTDLAEFVASCDAVLAHRMHACIAAYSYRVPAVGFAWDVKLKSFFELTGRGRYMVDLGAADAASVADLARQALAEGVDEATHHALVDRCRQDVRQVVARLRHSGTNVP